MSIRKGTSIIAGNIGQSVDSELSPISNNPVKNSVLAQTFAKTINYSYITNCITKIPQDIILDLTGNVLTLKAGSKIYYPNGFDGTNRIFGNFTLTNDLVLSLGSSSWTNEPHTIIVLNDGTISYGYAFQDVFSGDNAPTTTSQHALWYDTGNNIVRRTTDSGTTWSNVPYSLPVCVAINTGGHCDSISEFFNGIGYIGGHFFRLPGLSGLAPNGKAANGTYINEEWTIDEVMIDAMVGSAGKYDLLAGSANMRVQSDAAWFVQNSRPTVSTSSAGWYDTLSNKIYYTDDQGATWTQQLVTLLGNCTNDATRVTKFEFEGLVNINKTSGSSNIAEMLEIMYPVGGLYMGTQSSCPMSILMPGTTWDLVSSGKALWTGDTTNGNTTIEAGLPEITGRLLSGVDYTMDDTNKFPVVGPYSSNPGAFTGDGWITSQNLIKNVEQSAGTNRQAIIKFSAQSYNSIYGNSTTVQPPAYVVNVWRRTA